VSGRLRRSSRVARRVHAVRWAAPATMAYYLVTVLWRSAAVVVPTWLVGAVRRLQEDRRALADEAVVRERLRIDTELRATLGAAPPAPPSRWCR
jgi:hypothetical protein